MGWLKFAIGTVCALGAIALTAKSLNSYSKQAGKTRCKLIPAGEIVAREYDEGIIEVIKGPAYECYIKEG